MKSSTTVCSGLQLIGVTESFMKLHAENTEVKCYNCNKTGHMANACTEPKREMTCWRCGNSGHGVNDCRVSHHKVTRAPCLSIAEVFKQREAAGRGRGARGGRGGRGDRGGRGVRGGVHSFEGATLDQQHQLDTMIASFTAQNFAALTAYKKPEDIPQGSE